VGLPRVEPVDAFDLPEWLGSADVVWIARSSVRDSHLVRGELTGAGEPLACDLLAADRAFPEPVLDERWRHTAHQSWTHEQVLLTEYDARLTLAVPGTAFTPDLVLEALGRLARAIGVAPESFAATLRL